MYKVRLGRVILIFLLTLLGFTVLAEITWDSVVKDHLYRCTDSLFLDYVSGPSAWVHGAFVGNVSNSGDTISPGWSKAKLIALWLSFIAASLALSVAVAWADVRWRRADHAAGRRGFEPLVKD